MAGRHRALAADTSLDRHRLWRKRGISRGGSSDRIRFGSACRGISAASEIAATSARLDRNGAIAVVAAGLIWGLYNVGFAVIFSFGPSMLVERGWSIAAAGSTISIVLWLGGVFPSLRGVFSGC